MIAEMLGPYRVLSKVGEGGMGEVYRATDTNLKRQVAIKVLPAAVAADADRLARFQREAEVLAALNHPNIAGIYGLEKTPDLTALVMELVEGRDLSEIIAGPGLPLDDALAIARQIAEALEAAHEQGIIHRDLKPANVKVRPDGTVKVLDFGLAKALAPDGASASADLMTSPTLTARATQMGIILGTAAYMAPEQARGKAVDRRADVWAFGAVLYEMLTGRRAFDGEDVSLTLSQVLQREPDFDALPPPVPARVRRVLRACLQKNPKQRLGDMQSVRLALEGAFETPTPASPEGAAVATSAWKQPLPMAALGAVLAMLVAVSAGWALWPSPSPGPVRRYSVDLPDGRMFRGFARRFIAIAPDASAVVYNATGGLYLRTTDVLNAQLIPGTEVPLYFPVFSPDGQQVAYFSVLTGQLMRIGKTGGAPVVVASAITSPFGLSWAADGTLLVGQAGGIYQVPATGGTPELIIPAREGERLSGAELLPDGESVLFSATKSGWDEAEIVVQTRGRDDRTVLVDRGSEARYVPTGHLVYAFGDGLFGIAFDPGARRVSGGAVPLVQGVRRGDDGVAQYSISATGELVYVPGTVGSGSQWLLALSDSAGEITALASAAGRYDQPRVAPDGRRLAVEVEGAQETYIAIYDLDGRTALRRLTFGGNNRYPVWSADSQRVTFQSDREGDAAIFWQRADGSGPAERLTRPEPKTAHVPASWSPADETLLFSAVPVTGEQIGAILTYARATGTVTPFGGVAAANLGPVFSPDGRWVAYTSGGSFMSQDGTRSIYVEPFPATGAKYEVPVSSGSTLNSHPVWAPGGGALYFSPSSGRWSVVPVTTRPTVAFGNPSQLPRPFVSRAPGAPRGFDIMPDGRFVGRIPPGVAEGTAQRMEIVLNWSEELKRLVPVR